MKTKCEQGVHEFCEAYDEVENMRAGSLKAAEVTADALRALLFHRVVVAIYCKHCGKQIPLEKR